MEIYGLSSKAMVDIIAAVESCSAVGNQSISMYHESVEFGVKYYCDIDKEANIRRRALCVKYEGEEIEENTEFLLDQGNGLQDLFNWIMNNDK